MSNNANRGYGTILLAIIAGWFAIAIAASALLVFHAGSKYGISPAVAARNCGDPADCDLPRLVRDIG